MILQCSVARIPNLIISTDCVKITVFFPSRSSNLPGQFAENFVYLSDRKSNMIISGGVNIYPTEIEAALQEHPAIADIGVFGIPNDEWGESVKAAVELRAGFEASPALEAEILCFAREHLAGYKVPRSIDFEAELPRHPTGKLLVRLLRERYWRGRERRI